MTAPREIVRAASPYLKSVPGSKIVHLGTYQGAQAFCVQFPDRATVGFPPLFILNRFGVREINGEEALAVISSFY